MSLAAFNGSKRYRLRRYSVLRCASALMTLAVYVLPIQAQCTGHKLTESVL